MIRSGIFAIILVTVATLNHINLPVEESGNNNSPTIAQETSLEPITEITTQKSKEVIINLLPVLPKENKEIAILYGIEFDKGFRVGSEAENNLLEEIVTKSESLNISIVEPRFFNCNGEICVVYVNEKDYKLYKNFELLDIGIEECINLSSLPILPNTREDIEKAYKKEAHKNIGYPMPKQIFLEKMEISNLLYARFFNDNGKAVVLYVKDGFLCKDKDKLWEFDIKAIKFN